MFFNENSFVYEKHCIHCFKNINWYEDLFAYEKHLVQRCENINWYEDVVSSIKNILYTAVKTIIDMNIRLRMKNI